MLISVKTIILHFKKYKNKQKSLRIIAHTATPPQTKNSTEKKRE